MWLEPSDDEIDAQLKTLVKTQWSQPPTAVQIGTALDLAVFASLASGFVIRVWSDMYEEAVKVDGRPRDVIEAEVKEALKDLI